MHQFAILQRRGLLAAGFASLIAIASVGQAQDDISKVNGGITIDAGQSAGDLSTVNGGIKLEARASAGSIETVNGGIRLEENARARALESVNGGVRLADGVQIAEGLESVNGAITLLPGSRVGAGLENVNGTITLDAAQVGGQLVTTNGSILIGAGSLVEGGLLMREPKGWNMESRPPRVVIGPDAEVRGTLTFEREVRLYVHERARVGRIEGATPERFTGDTAPGE